MRRNIVLIGMMGAGKTAIGGELARRLGRPFADTDVEIERAATMTIPEIFARDGEEFLPLATLFTSHFLISYCKRLASSMLCAIRACRFNALPRI